MNNLQRHYLLQYTTVLEDVAVTGDYKRCLDTYLELRMKSDLSQYLRALVNIVICDFSVCSELPEVIELSNEAVKIAMKLSVSRLLIVFHEFSKY